MTSHTLVLNADAAPISILPLSTMPWQDAIRAVYLESVTVLHEYDTWDVHSPSTTMSVPAVVMSRAYINVDRRMGWSDRYVFLRDRYTCQYCGHVFPENELTLDHVTPRKYGGKTGWDNIVSACSPCNSRRGCDASIRPMNMPVKPSYWELVSKRKEYPLIVPHASWGEYLNWPEEKLVISGKNYRKNLRSDLAA